MMEKIYSDEHKTVFETEHEIITEVVENGKGARSTSLKPKNMDREQILKMFGVNLTSK